MQSMPFGVKDLVAPVARGIAPFLPVALLVVPLHVVIDTLIKLLH
jgi:hypothetical protein